MKELMFVLKAMGREARTGPFIPKILLSLIVLLVGGGFLFLFTEFLMSEDKRFIDTVIQTLLSARTILGILEIWCIPIRGDDDDSGEEESTPPAPLPCDTFPLPVNFTLNKRDKISV